MKVSSINQPDWLINEDILRDEGVIFGLSGSNPEEKFQLFEVIFINKLPIPKS
jgi:hypothetical protein